MSEVNQTQLDEEEINNLNLMTLVILCEGAKYMNKNESTTGLKTLQEHCG
jgi:hypothetical protein